MSRRDIIYSMSKTSIQDNFIHFFPPPKFLQMQAVGLDITDHRIRFLEFEKKGNGLIVKRYGEAHIATGIIVSGRLKRPKELNNILISFAKKYELEFVRVSLPEERAYLVKMEIPKVEEKNIRDTIAFQLEEYVPVPAQEAVFDYKTLGTSKLQNGYLDVAVSVFSQKEVDEYVDMFRGTGIKPISFEIDAQAIARAVIPKEKKGTYMVLDFGSTRTGIFIVSEGIVRFTSTIEIGSSMITRALEKQFSISTKEAEIMKNEKVIAKSSEGEEFFNAIVSSISILRDEINKLFIYWHTHIETDDNTKIEQIFMSGGGANLKGLSGYLSASMRIKVVIANPWINVNSFDNYIPEIPRNLALGYTSVIGLALTDKIKDKHYSV